MATDEEVKIEGTLKKVKEKSSTFSENVTLLVEKLHRDAESLTPEELQVLLIESDETRTELLSVLTTYYKNEALRYWLAQEKVTLKNIGRQKGYSPLSTLMQEVRDGVAMVKDGRAVGEDIRSIAKAWAACFDKIEAITKGGKNTTAPKNVEASASEGEVKADSLELTTESEESGQALSKDSSIQERATPDAAPVSVEETQQQVDVKSVTPEKSQESDAEYRKGVRQRLEDLQEIVNKDLTLGSVDSYAQYRQGYKQLQVLLQPTNTETDSAFKDEIERQMVALELLVEKMKKGDVSAIPPLSTPLRITRQGATDIPFAEVSPIAPQGGGIGANPPDLNAVSGSPKKEWQERATLKRAAEVSEKAFQDAYKAYFDGMSTHGRWSEQMNTFFGMGGKLSPELQVLKDKSTAAASAYSVRLTPALDVRVVRENQRAMLDTRVDQYKSMVVKRFVFEPVREREAIQIEGLELNKKGLLRKSFEWWGRQPKSVKIATGAVGTIVLTAVTGGTAAVAAGAGALGARISFSSLMTATGAGALVGKGFRTFTQNKFDQGSTARRTEDLADQKKHAKENYAGTVIKDLQEKVSESSAALLRNKRRATFSADAAAIGGGALVGGAAGSIVENGGIDLVPSAYASPVGGISSSVAPDISPLTSSPDVTPLMATPEVNPAPPAVEPVAHEVIIPVTPTSEPVPEVTVAPTPEPTPTGIVPTEISPIGEMDYVVQGGDNLWNITEDKFGAILDQVPPGHAQDAVIDAVMKKLDADPLLREDVGLQSDDINKILPGTELNLGALQPLVEEAARNYGGMIEPTLPVSPTPEPISPTLPVEPTPPPITGTPTPIAPTLSVGFGSVPSESSPNAGFPFGGFPQAAPDVPSEPTLPVETEISSTPSETDSLTQTDIQGKPLPRESVIQPNKGESLPSPVLPSDLQTENFSSVPTPEDKGELIAADAATLAGTGALGATFSSGLGTRPERFSGISGMAPGLVKQRIDREIESVQGEAPQKPRGLIGRFFNSNTPYDALKDFKVARLTELLNAPAGIRGGELRQANINEAGFKRWTDALTQYKRQYPSLIRDDLTLEQVVQRVVDQKIKTAPNA